MQPEGSVALLASIEALLIGNSAEAAAVSDEAKKDEPSDIIDTQTLSEEVPCGCKEHLERQELSILFPLNVDGLFDLLFDDNFVVGKAVHEKRHDKGLESKLDFFLFSVDLQIEPWKPVLSPDAEPDEEIFERRLRYMVAISNPIVKVRETVCFETLRLSKKIPKR